MKNLYSLPRDFRILIMQSGHQMARKLSATLKPTRCILTKNAIQTFGKLIRSRSKQSNYFIGMATALAIHHFLRMDFPFHFMPIQQTDGFILNLSLLSQTPRVKNKRCSLLRWTETLVIWFGRKILRPYFFR